VLKGQDGASFIEKAATERKENEMEEKKNETPSDRRSVKMEANASPSV